MTDEKPLLDRARDGERTAIAELLVKHQTHLAQVAKWKLGSNLRGRVSPSDVLQSAYFSALRGGFRGATEQEFVRWAERIVEHQVYDRNRYFQAERRRDDVPLGEADISEVTQDTATPSFELARTEDLLLLERALEMLEPDQRRIFELCVLEGRSHEDAAAELGRTTSATRSLLSRTRSQLVLLMKRLRSE